METPTPIGAEVGAIRFERMAADGS